MAGDIETGLAVLTEKVTSIDTKLDIQLAHIQSNVESKASKSDVGALRDRVSKIEGTVSWGVKLVIGAVILAIIGGGYLESKRDHPIKPTSYTVDSQPR